LSYGRGPVGTGAHLVGLRRGSTSPHEVEVWLLLLFVPIVPLMRCRVEAVAEDGSADVGVGSRSRPALGRALYRIAKGAAAAVVVLLPLAFVVWQVGVPWATDILVEVLGRMLSPGLLGKLGKAVEMGAVVVATAIPVLVLTYLDERVPRVSLREVYTCGH